MTDAEVIDSMLDRLSGNYPSPSRAQLDREHAAAQRQTILNWAEKVLGGFERQPWIACANPEISEAKL